MTHLRNDFEDQLRPPVAPGRFENEQVGLINPPLSGTTPSYSAPHRNTAYFEGKDIAAAVLASAMMLGPLVSQVLGFGQ